SILLFLGLKDFFQTISKLVKSSQLGLDGLPPSSLAPPGDPGSSSERFSPAEAVNTRGRGVHIFLYD
uniref:Uncharacterized protein n=1 Tax=Nothoprocta perdicaria TaxID=30464 RepID=A0A8C6YIE2_NOTPE